jgi:hypothetical protein
MDLADPMLAHQDDGVSAVKEVSCQVRKLFDDLFGNLRVSLGRDEHSQSR